MNKFFSIFILLSFISISATAQNFDLGIKVGANFSNIQDVSDLDSRTGLVAGAFATFGFGNMAIQPEVLYSQQGAKNDIDKFDLDYVNIPVMLKVYPLGKALNLQVGPQFGFLTHNSFRDQIKAKSYDFSGAAGIGVDLPFGLRVDGRYNFGLTDIFKDAKGKNGVFTISVGYSFL